MTSEFVLVRVLYVGLWHLAPNGKAHAAYVLLYCMLLSGIKCRTKGGNVNERPYPFPYKGRSTCPFDLHLVGSSAHLTATACPQLQREDVVGELRQQSTTDNYIKHRDGRHYAMLPVNSPHHHPRSGQLLSGTLWMCGIRL
jgi:hypothetical protein